MNVLASIILFYCTYICGKWWWEQHNDPDDDGMMLIGVILFGACAILALFPPTFMNGAQ